MDLVGLLPEPVDPRVTRAEERRAFLRELTELGMQMTRDLTRRTLAACEAPEPLVPANDGGKAAGPKPAPVQMPRHDPADSFARLSRAVRLTLALEAQVEAQISALIAGETAPVGKGRGAPPLPAMDSGAVAEDPLFYPSDHPSAHRNKIRDAVFDVINHEVVDVMVAQEALAHLYERLTEGEQYDRIVFRPLKETVEAICSDLGLRPDWTYWTDDGWSATAPSPRYYWADGWKPWRHVIKFSQRE